MDYDTAEYFNAQNRAAEEREARSLARSKASGHWHRQQVRHAGMEACVEGRPFSERATRKLHQRWDTLPTYRLAA